MTKKLSKAKIDSLKASLNGASGKQAKAVRDALKTIELAGLVTSGKGGGRGGINHTPAMADFTAKFDKLVKDCTKGTGFFIDAKGTKRIPRQYMPKPKPKK